MRSHSTIVLLLVILIGMVIGGVLGEILSPYIPILNYSESIGFSPVTVDLNVMNFTLGFMMDISIASIIGLVITLLVFRRLV